MSELKFSYKEAIAHGWAMTRKYWAAIFILTVVFFSVQSVAMVMDIFAGGPVRPNEVYGLFRNKTASDEFFKYLVQEEYIDQRGNVLSKLQDTKTAEDLFLPAELESQRAQIFDFLNSHRYRLPFARWFYVLLSIVSWVLYLLMSIGYLRCYLMLTRDQEPSVSELFIHWRFFIPYLISGLCYSLVCMFGILLLIVPGIIFSIMFSMYGYLIVDKNLGPIEALKHSAKIVKGSKRRLAVFGCWIFLLNLAGLLCLIIGVLVTGVISAIATAYVYDQLQLAYDQNKDAPVVTT